MKSNNRDDKVIEEFGSEWISYNYSDFDHEKLYINFMQYFEIFPWDLISSNAVGFDMGSGSGRWAQFVAPKVKELNCIEPSQAIDIARRNLDKFDNVNFLQETTDTCSLETNSQDFGYSLGVLHHIPEYKQTLARLKNLLSANGIFVIGLYHPWGKMLQKLMPKAYHTQTLEVDQEEHPFELSFWGKDVKKMFNGYRLIDSHPNVFLNYTNGGLTTYAFKKEDKNDQLD